MNSMKKAFWLIAALGVAALVTVDLERSGGPARQSGTTHKEFDYAFDKRVVFVADANADLSEFDQRIEELSQLATTASVDGQINAQAKIRDLREERAVLGQKLAALRKAREANWNDLKSDFQKNEDQLKASFKDVSTWLVGQQRS
jgi:TolA-binding protein